MVGLLDWLGIKPGVLNQPQDPYLAGIAPPVSGVPESYRPGYQLPPKPPAEPRGVLDRGWDFAKSLVPETARQAYGSGFGLIGEMSPGADVRDMLDYSQSSWDNLRSGQLARALQDMGWMGLATAGLLVPGNAGALRKAGGEVVDSVTDAGRKVDPPKKGIVAYHGSPHDFDRFDLSKIGTGEGAQAYGHGLYFAENEGVAKAYRDALAKDMYYSPTGEMFDPQSQLQHLNVRVAARGNGDNLDATIARALQLLPRASDATRPMIEHDLAVLRKFKESGGISKIPGKMYQVRINADPNDFLDWDKPLSQMPPQAAQSIAKLDATTFQDAVETINAAKQHKNLQHLLASGGDQAGMDLTGADVMNRLGGVFGRGDPSVTNKLRDAGFPGIKYLDAGSRTAGDGSRNYVVFDDRLIEILKKYGFLPAAGAGLLGGAALTQTQPDGT